MKKLLHILIPILLLFLVSCENEPSYFNEADSLYLSGDPQQRAGADSVLYSFRLYDFNVTEYTLNLIVNVSGYAADRDRPFVLELVESQTNVKPSDYTIGDFVMPKDAYTAIIPVGIRRTVPGLDLTKEAAKLTFRVVPNEHFQIGAEEQKQYTLMWSDYLIRPESWSNLNYYVGPFTQARFKFIIDFVGLTDFTEYNGNYNLQFWLQATCLNLLNAYNADPANAGRPEGWPYLNDNGLPLEFGENLQY